MSQERKYLVRGVFVNLAGIVIKISRPFYLILFSRLLGVESFGLYILAFAVQEAVSKFAILGLNWGAKRVVGHLKSSGRSGEITCTVEKILAVTLAFSIVVALSLALSAGWIAALLNQPALAPLLRIFCLGMPTLCGMYVLVYSYRPSLDMRYELYVCSVIEPVSVLVLGTIAILMGGGLQGVVAAHVIASVIAFGAAFYFLYRIFPADRGKRSQVDWGMLFHSSVGMGGMELLNNVKLRLDLFVIAIFLSLTHVGIYGAIVEIASLLRKARAAIDPILMPISQKLLIEEKTEKLREQLVLTLSWALQLGLAIFGVICLMPGALLALFGKDFVVAGAEAALVVFAAGQFFHMSLGLLEGVLAITGHAYVTLINMIVLMVLNMILLLYLVPLWGLPGAAVATTISYVGVTVWRVFQSRRLLEVSPFHRTHTKIVVVWMSALGAAALAGLFIDGAVIGAGLLKALLFLAVYGGLIFALRARGAMGVAAGR